MSKPSPAIQQYLELKKHYSEHLLLFQMGDFYELFFEDAVKAAKALDIALTRRGKDQGVDIPMCGVPLHASQVYLQRLIRQGFSIALCEQVETPATKTGKGPLKREVVRVMTPGTLTEETLLEPKSHHFVGCLVSSASSASPWGLAMIDLSTGDFFTETSSDSLLDSPLLNWKPREMLIPESLLAHPLLQTLRKNLECVFTPLPASRFHPINSAKRLESFFNVNTLTAFGTFHEVERTAAGSLLDYVILTQRTSHTPLNPPRQIQGDQFLKLDPFTRRNLELTHTLEGKKKGSLLSFIDQTVTPGGGRLLELSLQNPLRDVEAIQRRLEAVDFFYQNSDLCEKTRALLKTCPDVERPLTRLLLGRGGPKDLGMIRDVLHQLPFLKELFSSLSVLPVAVQQNIGFLTFDLEAYAAFQKGLKDISGLALPITPKEGGFVKAGYHPELDEWRALTSEAHDFLKNLEERYRCETQISTLKVRENNLIGLYLEVSQGQLSKVPPSFTLKQSMAQGGRYITRELLELQAKRQQATSKTLALELEIFEGWVQELAQAQQTLRRLAKALAALDVYTALAYLAREHKYCKPHVDHSSQLCIQKGFHPVVRATLEKETGSPFVANDCMLTEDAFAWLLTGPNMAGKSTFLRQNALIVLMAQMGSFVPAAIARLGVCDRIFSRVGASDNLARGESTFMVEMIETATILHQATARSFVILDEVGRGTATHDGLALAMACFEFLVQKQKCRTLFATHYHELTALEDQLFGVACYTPQITEWRGEIVFMHQVVAGKAQGSYGLHVARLAGLPECVLARAHTIQEHLSGSQPRVGIAPQKMESAPALPFSAVESYLASLNLAHISPHEALNILYSLQAQMNAKEEKQESVKQSLAS